jgi:hypothetical protein
MKRLLRKCCDTKLCRTVTNNFCFVGNVSIFNPEEGDSMFLRNVGIYLPVYTVSQRRKQHRHSYHCEKLSFSVLWSARNCLDNIYYAKLVSCNWFSVYMSTFIVLCCLAFLVRRKTKFCVLEPLSESFLCRPPPCTFYYFARDRKAIRLASRPIGLPNVMQFQRECFH